MSSGLGIIEDADPMLMTTPFSLFTMAGTTSLVIRVTDTMLALIRFDISLSLVTKKMIMKYMMGHIKFLFFINDCNND